MIQSMTGFASKSLVLENEETKIKLTLSLKSLNSRYFDVTSKLPFAFNQFETDFIRILKSKLNRGQIYFTIHLTDTNAFKISIEPATSTINGYVIAANKIKQKFNFKDEVSLSDILKLPNIFTIEEKGIEGQNKELIFTIFNELINDLIEERNKEGLSLQNDLEDRINSMKQKIDLIEKQSKIILEEYKEKISKKINELKNLDNNISDQQLQTLFLTLDKMDIHEEIVRFKSHLHSITNLIFSSVIEKGKQLDFTLQELAREINTITSKTPSAQIIELAISIKVEIEKSREQVQNIV